jgi:hypothetical protein
MKYNRKHIRVLVWFILIGLIISILYLCKTHWHLESFQTEGGDCLVGIDVVYYINLEHRTDRKDQVEEELSKLGVPESKIVRIDAVYNPEHGGLGCSASHIKAYQTFLQSPHTTCLILEDDFMFVKPPAEVRTFFTKLNNISYDVCMLSANENAPSFRTELQPENPFLRKVMDAQTASAYCVHKSFAPTLLQTVQEGYALLKQHPSNKSEYMNDMYWKRLQPNATWYIATPVLGIQRESYSDIEKGLMNYGV